MKNMNAEEFSDVLIKQERMLSYLGQVKGYFENKPRKTDEDWQIYIGLDMIITEIECCTKNCRDIKRIYRWTYCVFRDALPLIDDTNLEKDVMAWTGKLYNAWQYMTPYVLRFYKRQDTSDVLYYLGFDGVVPQKIQN